MYLRFNSNECFSNTIIGLGNFLNLKNIRNKCSYSLQNVPNSPFIGYANILNANRIHNNDKPNYPMVVNFVGFYTISDSDYRMYCFCALGVLIRALRINTNHSMILYVCICRMYSTGFDVFLTNSHKSIFTITFRITKNICMYACV